MPERALEKAALLYLASAESKALFPAAANCVQSRDLIAAASAGEIGLRNKHFLWRWGFISEGEVNGLVLFSLEGVS